MHLFKIIELKIEMLLSKPIELKLEMLKLLVMNKFSLMLMYKQMNKET